MTYLVTLGACELSASHLVVPLCRFVVAVRVVGFGVPTAWYALSEKLTQEIEQWLIENWIAIARTLSIIFFYSKYENLQIDIRQV